jgi:hypothetical protein
MSREAFNRFLSGLEPAERERLLLAAADFGMKPEDPEWIPFAAATSTLYAVEQAIGDVRKAASEAANDIIRTTANRLEALGKQATDQLAANAGSYNRQMLEQANAALAQMQLTLASDTAKAVLDHVTQLVEPLVARLEAGGRDFDAQRKDAGRSVDVAANHAVMRLNQIQHRSLWQTMGYAALGSAFTAMLFILFLTFVPLAASPVTIDTVDLAKRVTAAVRQQQLPVAASGQHHHRFPR